MKTSLKQKYYEHQERAEQLMSLGRELTSEEREELKSLWVATGGLRGGNGTEFFTPPTIAEFMVDILQPKGTVLEFSCGSGVFLNLLENKLAVDKLIGIEKNGRLAKLCEMCYPNVEIHHRDALTMLDDLENSVDYIIGNPPFGKLPNIYEGFTHSKKSLEEHFLELAVRCLKPNGEAMFILPEGILANKSSEKLREWVLDECYYLSTISLPKETFYHAGTGCKTSIIYIKKIDAKRPPKYEDYNIVMAIVDKIGWDSHGNPCESQLPEIKEMMLKRDYGPFAKDK